MTTELDLAPNTEPLTCAECGEEVPPHGFIADCDLCANLVDACDSCFQDHMTEQHDEAGVE